jgi:aspartate aminotransferase
MVRLAGATPVILPAPADQGFRITPAQLEAAITPRTKWLIFNSPSNPTGAVYTPTEIAALADVLRAAEHVWILADDIYEHLTYGVTFSTMAEIAPDLAHRTLTMNGVSKAYAMTGWRIGYAGGPAPLIAAMRKVQSQSTSNPCSISQHAALAALTGPQEFLADWRAIFARRRDLVVSRLAAIPGIDCPRPDGAFYVYPGIAGLIGRTTAGGRHLVTDEDFAMALLEEAGVAVVHGAAFGLSPAFRVSYALSDETIIEACDRIERFCAGFI